MEKTVRLVSRQPRLVGAVADEGLSRRTTGTGALILVFGGGGQLGQELAAKAREGRPPLVALDRSQADIAEPGSVEAAHRCEPSVHRGQCRRLQPRRQGRKRPGNGDAHQCSRPGRARGGRGEGRDTPHPCLDRFRFRRHQDGQLPRRRRLLAARCLRSQQDAGRGGRPRGVPPTPDPADRVAVRRVRHEFRQDRAPARRRKARAGDGRGSARLADIDGRPRGRDRRRPARGGGGCSAVGHLSCRRRRRGQPL